MPRTQIVLFRESDGSVPVLEWLAGLSPKARDKCVIRIHRLAELGHELRRPETDLLHSGIHELRIGLQGMNYRILYFFHGAVAAVLACGVIKERRVPPMMIEKAIRRRTEFEKDPRSHTHPEELA